MFSVQRVSKKFNGRNFGSNRAYSFYLPAHTLLLCDDGSQHDEDILQRLRGALDHFIGFKPFHNYTARRARAVYKCLATCGRR